MRALLLIALSVATSESRHYRLETDRGPVHVYYPRGYDPKTAGTVLYVHGYYDDVDSAWNGHGLADQFEASGKNAVFIAPEAPAADADDVKWDSASALLKEVRAQGLELPKGPAVAMAHSGGFRTLWRWLPERSLDRVVLLDGLYGAEEQFSAWVKEQQAPASLVLFGSHTNARTEKFVEGRSDVHQLEALGEAEPRARVVFVKSSIEHMEIVTGGKVIPAVLSWMPLSTSRREGLRPNRPAAARPGTFRSAGAAPGSENQSAGQ